MQAGKCGLTDFFLWMGRLSRSLAGGDREADLIGRGSQSPPASRVRRVFAAHQMSDDFTMLLRRQQRLLNPAQA
jgi:hypothetical protein